MEENGVAAGQSFDGNDLQATHVVAYLGDEPIGALRIRWFNDFAALERTAFRKKYRSPRYLKAASIFIFEHIARKGYSRVVTHASPIYARLWRSLLGFEQVPEKAPTFFVGHTEPYIELVKKLDVPENAITLSTSATVLFRVEGQWDASSKYEARDQSA